MFVCVCIEILSDIPDAAESSVQAAACDSAAGWSQTHYRRETISTDET